MRAAAALFAGLAIAAAGCGSDGSNVSARGVDAAQLVPPDALAYASADANFDSEQWRLVRTLTGFEHRRDLRQALGDEVNVAILGVDEGKPEAIALVHSKDDAKLRDFVAEFDRDGEHYAVEQVGGWDVVADSPEAFASVRAAESGRSLADVDGFQRAMSAVEGDALARAYADGTRLAGVPDALGALFRVVRARGWVGARVLVEDSAARISLRTEAETSVYRPRLLREVPSGALLAITFKNGTQLLQRIAAEPGLGAPLGEYRFLLTELAPAARDEGVFYVTQGLLVPTLAFLVDSPTPAEAAAGLRRFAATVKKETNGLLTMHVFTRGNRVLLTTERSWPSATGPRLVDDQPFKDVLAAADAPEEVTWLAYADLPRLVPIAQTLAQLLGADAPSMEEKKRLERLDALVAYGASNQVELRLTLR